MNTVPTISLANYIAILPSGLGLDVLILMVRAFAHGAMSRQIDPSWDEPIELFLFPASAPRLV